MDDTQVKSALEALLFISGAPVTVDRLQGIFEDVSRDQLEAQLQAIRGEYEARGAGIMLTEVAGGWQLATCAEQAAWVRKFKTAKVPSRLSKPALETLAIIAYKQPVTRPEIEAIRGVNIGGIVRNLMERRLVKIVGKKDVAGRPMLYGTTSEFLQYFGLKDLSSLPTLKEFQDLDAGEDAMVEELSDRTGGGPDGTSGGPLQDEAEEALDAAAPREGSTPDEPVPSQAARQG